MNSRLLIILLVMVIILGSFVIIYLLTGRLETSRLSWQTVIERQPAEDDLISGQSSNIFQLNKVRIASNGERKIIWQALVISDQFVVNGKGMDPDFETFEQEAESLFAKIESLCNKTGFELSDLVKLSAYVSTSSDLLLLEPIYKKHFLDHYPVIDNHVVSELPNESKIK